MPPDDVAPSRPSAVRWFALAAIALTITAAVGAHGLAWMADTQQRPTVAFLPLKDRMAVHTPAQGDLVATGSIATVRKSVLDH